MRQEVVIGWRFVGVVKSPHLMSPKPGDLRVRGKNNYKTFEKRRAPIYPTP